MKVAKNQLTVRQQRFCQHYAGSARHNAALAARMAGYAAASSHVTGCQLLQKPKIAATVRGLEAAVAVDMAYTRQRVIGELVGAFDMAKTMQNPASIIAAMRQVALMCGFYAHEPAKAVNADDQTILERMQGMTDGELMTMVAAGAA